MAATDALLIAVRALHYGATIVLFGELVFVLLISARPASAQGAPDEGADDGRCRRFRRVALAAWVSMVVSGACWLVLVTAGISGVSPHEITISAMATVLSSTVFGQAWSLRAVMASTLVFFWMMARARPSPAPWVSASSLAVAGGLLAGLAWAGHANANVGLQGVIHHAVDAAHLLAAGTWLGGLAPLAFLLKTVGASPSGRCIDRCAEIAARFGNWAAVAVGVLVVTGIANAYYLVAAPRALLDTTYGSVLLVKLLLFALMLAIAAVNRTGLTRALLANDAQNEAGVDAARALRRNVWTEQALGAGVLVLVAVLGVTFPPMRT